MPWPHGSALASIACAALPAATIPVFSEAHGPLQRMADRSAVLGNALTVPGAEGLHLLSGAKPGASGAAAGSPRVRAETAARIEHFLRDNGVACGESDTPQLGPRQSPAARAATLSVGVLCG